MSADAPTRFQEAAEYCQARYRRVRDAASQRPRLAVAVVASPFVAGILLLSAIWVASGVYADEIEARFAGGVFDPPTQLWSAPETLAPGDPLSLEGAAERWRRTEAHGDTVQTGMSQVRFVRGERPIEIDLQDGLVEEIRAGGKEVEKLKTGSALVTHLPDQHRTLRRIVAYEDIPADLRNAVVAVEDHRFFEHSGIDLIRTAKAVFEAVAERRRPRGTSTLTQQLSRGLFLTPERTYARKLAEFLIAFRLEQRLTKQQILAHYCNQIYMGRYGGFNIAGMAEAAKVYFDKEIGALDLHEAALLAGLLQRPSYLNPWRNPDRARARREVVLDAMLEHGHIDQARHRAAAAQPLEVVDSDIDDQRAPFFAELVEQELRQVLEGVPWSRGYEVETTLDLRLQRAALAAIEAEMGKIDKLVAEQRRFRDKAAPRPEVALVALDPRTGAVKALVGGRDYDRSQLNRALAKRQPGSTFKPFVYAAALGSSPYDQENQVFTTATPLLDWPMSIAYKDEVYRPANYGKVVRGYVTLRDALVHSLNIPTVRLAEAVGYDTIAALANKAGLSEVRATPSAALGSYETSPLSLAAAYTVFANGGRRSEPYFVESVVGRGGSRVFVGRKQSEEVLDQRVAYITLDMLTDVVNRGTAAGVRRLGYRSVAAGKTGTDDDGWFVGFTPNLLCLVWVGFDDNTDLGLTGADSALPIWAAFMKSAERYAEHRSREGFEKPEDLEERFVDPEWLTPENSSAYDEERLAEYLELVNEQIEEQAEEQVDPAESEKPELVYARFKPLEMKARTELFLPGTAPKARIRFPEAKILASFSR